VPLPCFRRAEHDNKAKYGVTTGVVPGNVDGIQTMLSTL